MAKDKIVLDIETQKGFNEITSRDNLAELRVSVCGVYSYLNNKFFIFEELELKRLNDMLKEAELVIGFNVRRFDLPVLAPYLSFDVKTLKCLDILDEIKIKLGYRLKLDTVAYSTLGIGKTGSGLDALRFYREGKLEELKRYCLNDVKITRDLYEFGKRQGKILYRDGVGLKEIAVNWA